MSNLPFGNLARGDIEKRLLGAGYLKIAGVDEVGRGCIAGPVTTAAVILDYEKLFAQSTKTLDLIRDSKKLSRKQRHSLIPIIQELATSYAITSASPRVIEKLGIVPATFKAMRQAIKHVGTPDILLVDGNQKLPRIPFEQQAVVGGDDLVYAIAAASILAKVERDTYMTKQSRRYPRWGFDTHVGYGTKNHISMIKENGICPLHRRNFAPINAMS